MQETVSLDGQTYRRRRRWSKPHRSVRALAVTYARDWLVAMLSAALLVLSFPDFDLWMLAWVGLVPLLVFIHGGRAVVASPRRVLLFGWIFGTLFFYGSCYWITYSMIHYGGFPAWVAYPLIVPATLVLGIFPALFCVGLAHVVARRGTSWLLVAPFLWVLLEWLRFSLTGQLWNAIGYSQAYVPGLIQAAAWGGVYAVGFLIVAVNASVAYCLVARTWRALAVATSILAAVGLTLWLSAGLTRAGVGDEAAAQQSPRSNVVIIGVQPNVSVDFGRSPAETAKLVSRHLRMSEAALRANWAEAASSPLLLPQPARVVVWPESPMNFTYHTDAKFRRMVAEFAQENNASVLFNSLEPAPADGAYNSAVMVDEAGRLTAQYDKIRLLPFGEYVPLPSWFPGTSLISPVVGDFTPGAEYPLMPLGITTGIRAGVFICFESAFPEVARQFAAGGADALINISNDGYLGRTPVMRQHLANSILRAVENNRTILRVTNTGITARISPRGEVTDATKAFEPAVRTWTLSRARPAATFYTKHGDLFVALCASVCLALAVLTVVGPKRHS